MPHVRVLSRWVRIQSAAFRQLRAVEPTAIPSELDRFTPYPYATTRRPWSPNPDRAEAPAFLRLASLVNGDIIDLLSPRSQGAVMAKILIAIF